MVVTPIYIPTNSVGGFFCRPSLAFNCRLFADDHSDRCERAPGPCWHSGIWRQGLEDSVGTVASPLLPELVPAGSYYSFLEPGVSPLVGEAGLEACAAFMEGRAGACPLGLGPQKVVVVQSCPALCDRTG